MTLPPLASHLQGRFAMKCARVVGFAFVLAVVTATAVASSAQTPAPPPQVPPATADEASGEGRTPPRLSYVDGQASFWRPGAPDWVAAQVNTPLAPGDELYTGSPGNLEVQIGARAYVRAWAGSALGLVNQDPDLLQLKVTAGDVSLDLRTLEPGLAVEVDTPNAAFTIDRAGYYRVRVAGERTSFITRDGGRATVTPASGAATAIASSQVVVVEGVETPRITSSVAPQLDEWDRWNSARSDYLVDAVSARYVPAGVYGASDLDHYGRWRVVPDYGSVWVPASVPEGWAPYSTGSWIWDRYYGWTWVDTAPWGWAPFHYGRWVFVNGFWGWAPGPPVVRPAYAPALVAFFGGGPSVGVRIGPPVVGWVALGWGEPCIPWWGGSRFVGKPWWGGWGGPRVVNNVVVNKTKVVNVQNITVYRNANVRNAVVAVQRDRFGHGRVAAGRVAHVDVRGLEPVRGRLAVQPASASLAPTTVRGPRPSDDEIRRRVVATRESHREPAPPRNGEERKSAGGNPPRPVSPPRQNDPAVTSRPPLGRGRAEGPEPSPAPPTRSSEPRSDGAASVRQRREPPRREGTTVVPPAPAAGIATPPPAAKTAPPPRREERAATPPPPAVQSAPRAAPPDVQRRRDQRRDERATPPPPTIQPAPRAVAPAPSVRGGQRATAPPAVLPPPRAAMPNVSRGREPRPQSQALPGRPAIQVSPGRGDVKTSRPQPNGGKAARNDRGAGK